MGHGDITHLEIPVADMARAREFYGAVFGWSIQDYPGYEGYPMWQGPNGANGGALTERSQTFTQPRATVEVASIEDTVRAFTERGGRVVIERAPVDDTSWWAVVEDPDGNAIGLFEGPRTGASPAADERTSGDA